jgi:putative oxidoreductase
MRATTWIDRGLLLVRIAVGLVFVMHGGQKWFVFGHAGTAAFLAQIGIPLPSLSAVLISTAEFGGGLAVLAGLGTRIAGAVLAFSMAVAIATVHVVHGFFAPAGVEYPLTLLLTNLALVMTGAGAYSIDAKILRRPTAGSSVTPRKAA